MELEEVWAEVDGFPDYAVSNYGRVQNVKTGVDLRPRVDSYGYRRVTLRRDNRSTDKYVHRMVMEAFATGYREGINIKWADGDRGNNYILNLRFGRERRLGQMIKNHPPLSHLKRVRIIQTGEIYRNVATLARRLGADESSVYKVLRGERMSHMGYQFEWLEGSE